VQQCGWLFLGPCGGKTTGQARLRTFFESIGWKVCVFTTSHLVICLNMYLRYLTFYCVQTSLTYIHLHNCKGKHFGTELMSLLILFFFLGLCSSKKSKAASFQIGSG